MTEEEDSSISEEMKERMDLLSVKVDVDGLSTKIRYRQESVEDFVSSMRKENSGNTAILRKLQEIEDDFQEEVKAKAELKDIQRKVKERYEDVVEYILKAEYEKEIETLKNNLMEGREAAERIRQEHVSERNARLEIERQLRNVEEDSYDKANCIETLRTDIDTERNCYKIITERLQAEQDRVNQLEDSVKKSDEVSISHKAFIEELKSTLYREEKQKSEYQCKLGKVEQEKKEKEHEVRSLISQLDEERANIDNLLADMYLEKMAKSKVEVKLQELEIYISRDEQLFEELREDIDLESGRIRELAELLDREREKNLELEDNVRELEKQLLLDLQLFDEFKMTIEQEREHNRELDELLNSGNYDGYNNRDSLLAELDGQLDELKSSLEAEKGKTQTLMADVKKREEESTVRDLPELLRSEIMHTADLKQQLGEECEKHRTLEKKNKDDDSKITTLENALKRVGGLSVQVVKELEEELGTIELEFLDGKDAYVFDENRDYENETEKYVLRLKSLLSHVLQVKNKSVAKTEEYQTQIKEKDVLLTELNITAQRDRCSLEEMKEEMDHKEREVQEKGNLIKEMESKLEEERNNTENLKRALEDEASKLKEVVKEGAVTETEEKETRNRTRIEELQIVLRRFGNEKKEKESESESYKTLYKEEHKFAKERRELNKRLSQQLMKIEALNNHREEEIGKLTKEKIDLLSEVEEVKGSLVQRQAIADNELEEKIKQLCLKESEVIELQTIIEHLSTIHMHKRMAGREKRDNAIRFDDTKLVLKEIEDELLFLDGELVQKDKEIDRLINECRRTKADNSDNEKHLLELDNEIRELRPLVKYHEDHAKKAVSAMKKTKLLCEILQTDSEMKDLQMSRLNNDINDLKNCVKEKEENVRKIEARYKDTEAALKDRTRELDDTRKERTKEPTTVHSNIGQEKESEDETYLTEDKVLQIERLNDRIMHMRKLMQKLRDDNQRTMADKDNEIQKQGKAIAVMKIVYLDLKAESKRDDIVGEMRQLKVEPVENLDTVSDDAAFIIQDLEAQIKTLRNDVESRMEVVQGLKDSLREMKKTKPRVERRQLRSRENVNRLLLIQLDEMKKKLKRLEKMHECMMMIYNVTYPKKTDGIENYSTASYYPGLTSMEDKVIARYPTEREEKANIMALHSVSKDKDTLSGEGTKPNVTEIVSDFESAISISVNRVSLKSATPDLPDAQQGLLNEIPADVERNTDVTADTVEGQGATSGPMEESKKDKTYIPNIKVPIVRIADESYLMALSSNVGNYLSEMQESSKQGDKINEQTQGRATKSTKVKFGLLPNSGWKVKLLVYIFIAAGLSVLLYYLKT